MNKKILSLTLALVMILGTFTAVFAAEENKHAEFLNKEGILLGDTEGNLNLDQVLVRRDSVILFTRLLGVEEEAKKTAYDEKTPAWTDVRTDAYYLPFFAWAEATELYNGKENGLFGPHDEMTVREYATVLLRALDYKEEAGEWNKIMDTAKNKGILVGLENAKADDKVTRAQVADMTYNALGVTMKGSNKTLAENLDIKMPEAEKLELVKVSTENLAEIKVELSNAKLADKAKLENPSNYTLKGDNNPTVKSAKVEGNDVVLTLVPSGRVEYMETANALVKGRKYELTIRNIDNKINVTEKNIVAVDNTIPAVESVEFLGENGIKVVTTEPIKYPQERNFKIDGSRTAMIIEQYGREIILTPYHKKAFDKSAKTLTITGMEDFAGYKSVETDFDLKLSEDQDAPKVVKALRSGNKLVVEFDKDVYFKSVKGYESRREEGNVSFTERRSTVFAKNEFDSVNKDKQITPIKTAGNIVEYRFERDIPKNTDVTILGVENHSGKAMDKVTVNPDLFVDEYAPVVISKLDLNVETKGSEAKGDVTRATKSMEIIFDKDIKQFNGAKASEVEAVIDRYMVVYKNDVKNSNVVRNVKIKVDEVKKDRIKISFDGLNVNNKNRDYDYVLEIKDLEDLNKNRMDREYIDFQIIEAKESFQAESIKLYAEDRYTTEVSIRFNKAVDKSIAENEKNYFFGTKKETKADKAIVERDGKTVTLVVNKNLADTRDFGILEISPNILDIDEKQVSNSTRFWNLKTEKLIPNTEVSVTDSIKFIDVNSGKEIEKNIVELKQGDKVKVQVENKSIYTVRDSKGKVTDTKIIDSTDNTELAMSTLGKNTIEVSEVDSKVSRVLEVNVLADINEIKVKFDGKSYTLDSSNKKQEIVVSYDANLITDYKAADFEVEGLKGTEIISATYNNGKLTVYTKSEAGILNTDAFEVELKNADVKTVTVKSAKYSNNVVEIEVIDSLDNSVKTLKGSDITLKTGTTSSETSNTIKKFTNNNNGSYLLEATNNLVIGENVVVTVGSVDGNKIID